MLDHDGLNFPVYRYADVLLMYAEALNEWKKVLQPRPMRL